MGKELTERLRNVGEQVNSMSKEYDSTLAMIKNLDSELVITIANMQSASTAMSIIQTVGEATQQYAVSTTENLVTTALRDVFGEEGYDFKIEIEHKRKTMNATFYFVRDGEKYEPLDCCGYGAVDVACFALRVAMWSLCPTEAVMLFDEPFKNVSKEYRARVAEFVKKIADTLSFQFIINTHMEEFLQYGDRIFRCTKKGVEQL
jgi:DNA repair exonuclease SbcCD ATPase subunit